VLPRVCSRWADGSRLSVAQAGSAPRRRERRCGDPAPYPRPPAL